MHKRIFKKSNIDLNTATSSSEFAKLLIKIYLDNSYKVMQSTSLKSNIFKSINENQHNENDLNISRKTISKSTKKSSVVKSNFNKKSGKISTYHQYMPFV